MSAAELVFGDGDRVRGWGRLVVDDEGRWLDVSGVVPLSMSRGPRPRNRRFSIPVVGAVDAAAVPTDFGPPGVIPGWVTLTGVWNDESLQVEQQRPRRHPQFDERLPGRTLPPCPAPAGGWPSGADINELDAVLTGVDELRSSGAAVTVGWLTPGPGRAVLVVAATDVDLVRRVLGPQLPGRLCVVPSRWTRVELDAVHDAIRRNWRAWMVDTWGEDVDHMAQAAVSAHPVRVSVEMAAWADTLPAGLLTFRPALRPAREDTLPRRSTDHATRTGSS